MLTHTKNHNGYLVLTIVLMSVISGDILSVQLFNMEGTSEGVTPGIESQVPRGASADTFMINGLNSYSTPLSVVGSYINVGMNPDGSYHGFQGSQPMLWRSSHGGGYYYLYSGSAFSYTLNLGSFVPNDLTTAYLHTTARIIITSPDIAEIDGYSVTLQIWGGAAGDIYYGQIISNGRNLDVLDTGWVTNEILISDLNDLKQKGKITFEFFINALTRQSGSKTISMSFWIDSCYVKTLSKVTDECPVSPVPPKSLLSDYGNALPLSVTAEDPNGWESNFEYYYSDEPADIKSATKYCPGSSSTSAVTNIPFSEWKTHINEDVIWRYQIKSGYSSGFSYPFSSWFVGNEILDDCPPEISNVYTEIGGMINPDAITDDPLYDSLAIQIIGRDDSGWHADVEYFFSDDPLVIFSGNSPSTSSTAFETLTTLISRTNWIQHVGEDLVWRYRLTDDDPASEISTAWSTNFILSMNDDSPQGPTFDTQSLVINNAINQPVTVAIGIEYATHPANFLFEYSVNGGATWYPGGTTIEYLSPTYAIYTCHFGIQTAEINMPYRCIVYDGDNDRPGDSIDASYTSSITTLDYTDVQPVGVLDAEFASIIPGQSINLTCDLNNDGTAVGSTCSVLIIETPLSTGLSSIVFTKTYSNIDAGASWGETIPSLTRVVEDSYRYILSVIMTDIYGNQYYATNSLMVECMLKELDVSTTSDICVLGEEITINGIFRHLNELTGTIGGTIYIAVQGPSDTIPSLIQGSQVPFTLTYGVPPAISCATTSTGHIPTQAGDYQYFVMVHITSPVSQDIFSELIEVHVIDPFLSLVPTYQDSFAGVPIQLEGQLRFEGTIPLDGITQSLQVILPGSTRRSVIDSVQLYDFYSGEVATITETYIPSTTGVYTYILNVQHAKFTTEQIRVITVLNPAIPAIRLFPLHAKPGEIPYVMEDLGFNLTIQNPSTMEIQMIIDVKHDATSISYPKIIISPTQSCNFIYKHGIYPALQIADEGTHLIRFTLHIIDDRGNSITIDNVASINVQVVQVPEPLVDLYSYTADFGNAFSPSGEYVVYGTQGYNIPTYPYKSADGYDNLISFKFRVENTAHVPIKFDIDLTIEGVAQEHLKGAPKSALSAVNVPAGSVSYITIDIPIISHVLGDIATTLLEKTIADIIEAVVSIASGYGAAATKSASIEKFLKIIEVLGAFVPSVVTGIFDVVVNGADYLIYHKYRPSLYTMIADVSLNGPDLLMHSVLLDDLVEVKLMISDLQILNLIAAYGMEVATSLICIALGTLAGSADWIGLIAGLITYAVLCLLKYNFFYKAYEDPYIIDFSGVNIAESSNPLVDYMIDNLGGLCELANAVGALTLNENLYENQTQVGDLEGAVVTCDAIAGNVATINSKLSTFDDYCYSLIYLLEQTGNEEDISKDNLDALKQEGFPEELARQVLAEQGISLPEEFFQYMVECYNDMNTDWVSTDLEYWQEAPDALSVDFVSGLISTEVTYYQEQKALIELEELHNGYYLSDSDIAVLDSKKAQIETSFTTKEWNNFLIYLDQLEQIANQYLNASNDPICMEYLRFINEKRTEYQELLTFNGVQLGGASPVRGKFGGIPLAFQNDGNLSRNLLLSVTSEIPLETQSTDPILIPAHSVVYSALYVKIPLSYGQETLDFTVIIEDVLTGLKREFSVHCSVILDDDVTPPIIEIDPFNNSSLSWDLRIFENDGIVDKQGTGKYMVFDSLGDAVCAGSIDVEEMTLTIALPIRAGPFTLFVNATNNDNDWVGDEETSTRQVTIEVTPEILELFTFKKLSELLHRVRNTTPSEWRGDNDQRKTTMLAKLEEVRSLLLSDNYSMAYQKLLYDVKPKLTGVKLNEQGHSWGTGVFNNPWITNASTSNECMFLVDSILAGLRGMTTTDVDIVGSGFCDTLAEIDALHKDVGGINSMVFNTILTILVDITRGKLIAAWEFYGKDCPDLAAMRVKIADLLNDLTSMLIQIGELFGGIDENLAQKLRSHTLNIHVKLTNLLNEVCNNC